MSLCTPSVIVKNKCKIEIDILKKNPLYVVITEHEIEL